MSAEKRNDEERAPVVGTEVGRPMDGYAEHIANSVYSRLDGLVSLLLEANLSDLIYKHDGDRPIEAYAKASASDLACVMNTAAAYCRYYIARSVEADKKRKPWPSGVSVANWPASVMEAGKRQEVLDNFLETLRTELIELLQDPRSLSGYSEHEMECLDFRKAAHAQLCGNEADK